MKKLILSVTCATALAASLAQAQTSTTSEATTTTGDTTVTVRPVARERTSQSTTTTSDATGTSQSSTTTTTTMGTGTVTEYVPGESIVLKTEAASPVHYKLSKKVTYVNRAGKTIEATTIKKSSPVSVHYMKEGDSMIVDRVTVDQD